MNDRMLYTVTRTGLLLAVTLLLQGIRLLLPIPPQVSMFLIGSLVNACLILAVLKVGWKSGLVVACITPVFAWLEGMLPFLPFIIPVAVGNSVLVGAVYRLRAYNLPGVYGAAVCKMAAIYGAFYLLFGCVEFPAAVRHMILMSMSWPQLVTGVLGGTIAYRIAGRIHSSR